MASAKEVYLPRLVFEVSGVNTAVITAEMLRIFRRQVAVLDQESYPVSYSRPPLPVIAFYVEQGVPGPLEV